MKVDEKVLKAMLRALGPEKLAELQRTPLNVLVRNKIAADYGIELSETLPLEDAVGALAISWRTKKATHAKIHAGLQSLRAVLSSRPEKTAHVHSQVLPYDSGATVLQKVAAAKKLRAMQASSGSVAGAARIGAMRTRVNRDIVSSLSARGRAAEKSASLASAGKGLAFGAGTAVPLYLAGSYLADKKMDEAQDRVFGTALGLGALGTVAYGGKKLIDRFTEDRAPQKQAAYKRAEVITDEIAQLIGEMPPEELLRALYLNEVLEDSENGAGSEQQINDERIVKLLEESLQ